MAWKKLPVLCKSQSLQPAQPLHWHPDPLKISLRRAIKLGKQLTACQTESVSSPPVCNQLLPYSFLALRLSFHPGALLAVAKAEGLHQWCLGLSSGLAFLQVVHELTERCCAPRRC